MNCLLIMIGVATVSGFLGFKLGRRKRRRPSPYMPLDEQVNVLFGLFLRTYGLYLFLKPMLFDQALIARYSSATGGRWFVELRNVLYWNLVLEICKLTSDGDNRAPCIRKLRTQIARPETRQRLKNNWVQARPDLSGMTGGTYELLRDAEQKSQRRGFSQHYQRLMKGCERLANNPVLKSYRDVRNKLIAHNEHKVVNGKLTTLDVATLGLKYGDERLVLENMKLVMDEMSAVVRGAAFDWDTFFGPEQLDVDGFWSKGGASAMP